MEKVAGAEKELTKSHSDSEKNRLQEEVKENKGKLVEEVNARLTAEIGPLPKITAQIEWKNINFSQFFSFNKSLFSYIIQLFTKDCK